jgi:acetylornithine deacetylase/succinyl-diaminopimelate desuccinylase-like protein
MLLTKTTFFAINFLINQILQITEKGPIRDYLGRPLMTATNDSNPWWLVFKKAITATGEKLSRPEILASTTDARYIRQKGIPVLGFSPMKNTPILLHEHNEVKQLLCNFYSILHEVFYFIIYFF